MALILIDYAKDTRTTIFGMDASLIGWEVTLMQIQDSKKYLARYESEIWMPQEKIYDVIK